MCSADRLRAQLLHRAEHGDAAPAIPRRAEPASRPRKQDWRCRPRRSAAPRRRPPCGCVAAHRAPAGPAAARARPADREIAAHRLVPPPARRAIVKPSGWPGMDSVKLRCAHGKLRAHQRAAIAAAGTPSMARTSAPSPTPKVTIVLCVGHGRPGQQIAMRTVGRG